MGDAIAVAAVRRGRSGVLRNALGHKKKGPCGRRLRPGLQSGACLYSLMRLSGRKRFSRLSIGSGRHVSASHSTRAPGATADPARYGAALLACSAINPATTVGFSMFGKWPAPLMISKREPLMSAAVSRTMATGVEPSSSPTRQRVGDEDGSTPVAMV